MPAARGPSRGQDREALIRLTLEEAARGGSREIQMTEPDTGQTRKLRVKIPPGVRPGQRIRLADQGGPAPPGGTRGSLYLKVELLPHPRYRLEGSGRKIRLRGLGFPGAGEAKGDLYAEIKIVVPDTLTEREKRLFSELAEASPFEARPSD